MVTQRFIDVSNHQGSVNWTQVKGSGVAGAFCKATEGTTYVDPTFAPNWHGLETVGLKRGAYHFARPGDPTAQAQFFWHTVQPLYNGEPLCLDLEVRVGSEAQWALTFLQTLQHMCSQIPWIYSYSAFTHTYLNDERLKPYTLWLAAYQSSPPPCPPPWTTYQLWQHTDAATIPGIAGPVDESLGSMTITMGAAMARVQNPVAAHPMPGGDNSKFAVMGWDGAMFAFNGANYCGAYNQHSDWWGGPSPTTNRAAVDFAWDDDGWGYTQYFDDGAYYHIRAEGH